MRLDRVLPIAAGVVLLALFAWAVSRGLERLAVAPAPERPAATAPAPGEGVPRITAMLYYGSDDGQSLIPLQQEVPLADGAVQQGREILMAQLASTPPPPHVSVIPEGTQLRAFYMTERGDAFVDLSAEVSVNHPGGSAAELLTIYAIVNSVTANLPAIERVQILIDGLEADTLAGHVDLRRALQQDASLVRDAQ